MNAPTSSAAPPKTVLIVDDVEDNRVLLDRALKSSGYVTIHAASGREALSMISRHMPDIVLLDWMMPGFSGLDTLRAIRETHPKTRLPVIMCTAMGEEMSVVTAINEGANDYMLKPISLAILRARMAAHLDQRDAIDSLASEKLHAERKLGERTREMLTAMSRDRDTPPPAANGASR
ncbi:response regulator [Sphingomonas sp. MAH-20]|uniref:Response regulator n=1 Tax=Sphingomonas horti TaxID=2682842 RepID=A0A6I4IX74_9SPHN|nr:MULTISPECIES: response regulator [Sphingomonas]MBA2920464.1 response regulator [Sphingomonas sp. CGMCC 1.13658]MVO76717.1 response regulator [Sphingomonas horti]